MFIQTLSKVYYCSDYLMLWCVNQGVGLRSRELCPGVVPLTWQGNFICKLILFSLSLIAATCRAIIGKTSWSEKAMILSKSKIGLVYNHCWFAIYRNVLLSPQRSSTAFSARRPFKLRMEGLSTWICASWNLVQLPTQAAVNLWTFSL